MFHSFIQKFTQRFRKLRRSTDEIAASSDDFAPEGDQSASAVTASSNSDDVES